MQQRIDEAVASVRRDIEELARVRIEAARAKAELDIKEAAVLKKGAEAMQQMLAEQIEKAKKAEDEAAQHRRDADDKAKQADERVKQLDEARKATEEQGRLLKTDRERHEARFIELLAQDPCAAARRPEGGAASH